MTIITLATAKEHLRVDGAASDAEITLKLSAAESIAQHFLNRRVFATQPEFTAALASVQSGLQAASTVYDTALDAAMLIEDERVKTLAVNAAMQAYKTASQDAQSTYAGIVINDQIKAAMLLILGHLYENRQDVQADGRVAELPMGAMHILQPYREFMGV